MEQSKLASKQKRVPIADSGSANRTFSASDVLMGRVTAGDVLRLRASEFSAGGPERSSKIASALDLGRFVRQARRARNLSQQDFADLAGIGRRFLSELENGKPTIEFDKALKAATAAGIDLVANRRG